MLLCPCVIVAAVQSDRAIVMANQSEPALIVIKQRLFETKDTLRCVRPRVSRNALGRYPRHHGFQYCHDTALGQYHDSTDIHDAGDSRSHYHLHHEKQYCHNHRVSDLSYELCQPPSYKQSGSSSIIM